ncbi:SMP-30/gluconolactonase/LRE family protein [Roseovarius sp. S1116L3]|uniref:SMP-30/gluconolactonase/LRE family protein n=1 Tax=Roseovarius roseus TaxID=3342636 RepID=UPI00372A698F
MTDIYKPELTFADVTPIGRDLMRPESVHVMGQGRFAVSHRGRGVSFVAPDGSVTTRGPVDDEFIPNGIAPQPDGSFLIANIGEDGGVWRLTEAGDLERYLMDVDGVALSAANFVMTDEMGRTWITVSTVSRPRFAAYSDKVRDGLIVMVDGSGPRLLADDICFSNECRLTPDGDGLVISETFSRRVTRFDLGRNGLSNRRTFVQFGRGDFPDGIRFDAHGNLWVTCIVSNRLWRVTPDGQKQLVLEDSDDDWVDAVETALSEGRMGREHFYETGKSRLGNIASIDFSADGRTAYLGSLCGTSIVSIPTTKGQTT